MSRVLVLGAGGPAGVNFCTAAHEGGHGVIGADTSEIHVAWMGDEVDRMYRSPIYTSSTFPIWIDEICETHRIHLIHSQPEQTVQWLADNRDRLRSHVLLPDKRTIALLQDKFETTWRWSAAGVRPFPVFKIEIDEQIDEAAAVLGWPMWVRATRGAGARGSTLAYNRDTASHWIDYWRARAMDWEFIAEEYLPGRDFAWTSLWRDGECVISQARQRIEYIYPHLAPSGRTGTPTAAVTVTDLRVDRIAEKAVLTIDPQATGIFCVDLREDKDGNVLPTEINAGRFFTTSLFYARAGFNFVNHYIRASAGIWPIKPIRSPLPEGLWWLRHIDVPGVVVDERERPELAEIRKMTEEVMA